MLTHRKRAMSSHAPSDVAQDAAQDAGLLGLQGSNATHHLLLVVLLSLTRTILRSRQCHIHGCLYHETTCATCTAPLDLSEADLYIKDPHIFCTRSRAPNHPPFQCLSDCGLRFNTLKDLDLHSAESGHDVFRCPFPNCVSRFSGDMLAVIRYHLKISHGDAKYMCAECGVGHEKRTLLDAHGLREGHSAYACQHSGCNSTAAQFADLVRHQACHKKDVPRYPCPRCPS